MYMYLWEECITNHAPQLKERNLKEKYVLNTINIMTTIMKFHLNKFSVKHSGIFLYIQKNPAVMLPTYKQLQKIKSLASNHLLYPEGGHLWDLKSVPPIKYNGKDNWLHYHSEGNKQKIFNARHCRSQMSNTVYKLHKFQSNTLESLQAASPWSWSWSTIIQDSTWLYFP